MMAFSGVRSSWLMLARKSVFAAAAASAFSRASTSVVFHRLAGVDVARRQMISTGAPVAASRATVKLVSIHTDAAVLGDLAIFEGARDPRFRSARRPCSSAFRSSAIDEWSRAIEGAELLGGVAERRLDRRRDVAPDAVDAERGRSHRRYCRPAAGNRRRCPAACLASPPGGGRRRRSGGRRRGRSRAPAP